MSSEERIRRAEEIYNRRKEKYNGNIRVSSSSVNVNSKPEYTMLKKVILQVLICLVIYLIFYLIKNSDYIFSENFLQRANEFLSYDINFQSVYETVSGYYNNVIGWFSGIGVNKENTQEDKQSDDNTQEDNNAQEDQQGNTSSEENQQGETSAQDNQPSNTNTQENQQNAEGDNNIENTQVNEETQVDEKNKNNENNNQTNANQVGNTTELGIGGGTDNEENQQNAQVELSQMEIDANFIKENCSLILPLKGTITSRYGPREATEIVSANHKGIDIAANTGTVFCAAMAGTVVEVSSEGSYGNHIYIQNGEVVTLYAHCSKIYLQKGQIVAQGMQIGEVGETGNATGPHLHFEIRRSGRTVNPEYIMSF